MNKAWSAEKTQFQKVLNGSFYELLEKENNKINIKTGKTTREQESQQQGCNLFMR